MPGRDPGEDTLLLAAATYDFATISGGTEDGNESGDLDTGPTSAIRVVGQGPGVTVIDAHGQDRVFDVFQGARLTLDGLTLRNGATAPGGVGGAVRNQGT